ncbi:hypothetical protein ACFQX4_23210 [Roseomonas sp. GCM10028921]
MTIVSPYRDDGLTDGTRIGRFVILRDVDGVRHAVSSGGVQAMGDLDGDTLVHLSGARTLRVPHSLATLLSWFEMR